ncbi:MAG: CRISPR system precrRNA processing endoribonuclease RAMP protein Cas6 [Candidatus Kryptonium sp.]
MPISFVLTFKISPKDSEERRRIFPDQLHGLFFRLLPREVADNLHKPSVFRPYSLWCPVIFKSEERLIDHITRSGRLKVTVSLVDDNLFSPFLARLFEIIDKKEHLFLGPYRIKLSPLDERLLSGYLYYSFSDFFPKDKPSPYFKIKFLTPVYLKRNGTDTANVDLKSLIGNLVRKWNFFSDIKIDHQHRSSLENKLRAEVHRFKPLKIHFASGGKLTCLLGEFTCHGAGLTEDELTWAYTLFNFGAFVGVGGKTTMGLGLTAFENLSSAEI